MHDALEVHKPRSAVPQYLPTKREHKDGVSTPTCQIAGDLLGVFGAPTRDALGKLLDDARPELRREHEITRFDYSHLWPLLVNFQENGISVVLTCSVPASPERDAGGRLPVLGVSIKRILAELCMSARGSELDESVPLTVPLEAYAVLIPRADEKQASNSAKIVQAMPGGVLTFGPDGLRQES